MPTIGKIPIAAAITHELHQQLLQECQETGTSKNALIAAILEAHYNGPKIQPTSTPSLPDTAAVDRLIKFVAANSLFTKKELKKIADGE